MVFFLLDVTDSSTECDDTINVEPGKGLNIWSF